MKYRCAWCGFTWSNALKVPPGLEPGAVSHGLCEVCAARLNKELDAAELKKESKKGKTENEKAN